MLSARTRRASRELDRFKACDVTHRRNPAPAMALAARNNAIQRGRPNQPDESPLSRAFIRNSPVGDAQPRWLRRPSYTSGWPVLIIRAVRVRQCILKITIVIFELQLVHL